MPELDGWTDGIAGLKGLVVKSGPHAGVAAKSWLVDRDGETFVLRRESEDSSLGLDRESEWSIMHAAFLAGLAPEPVFRDAERGWSLRRYVDGPSWDKADEAAPERWRALGRLLRRVHEVEAPDAGTLDVGAAAHRYARLAGGDDAALASAVRIEREAHRLCDDAPRVPCHNDAHLGNVVGEGVLIDWEYAALGHPLFDLAVVIGYHDLSAEDRDALVGGWAGEKPLAKVGLLPEFIELYRELAMLWERAVRS